MLNHDFIRYASRVFDVEADAILDAKNKLGQEFIAACQLLLCCSAKVIVLGIGKSSHIGAKIAATLASTGTPAFFVHAAEASHGDLGMIGADDVVIAISHSGETAELVNIIPAIKFIGVKLIAICGRRASSLALAADVFLDAGVREEACPLGLAPTASTTVALALGDALAVSLLQARDFRPVDFARTHPGGSLGKRLLLTVRDLMHQGDRLPKVSLYATVAEGLMEMSSKGFGMTMVLNAENAVIGVFTDGDLRRMIDRKIDVHDTLMRDVMTPGGRRVSVDLLATEALALMEQFKITTLMVLDEAERPLGLVHMYDLLQAGVS
jgi:arabinose-5-phosphate isomerase